MTFFLIGVLLVTSAVSYLWWTRVRVIALREDLFEIRDQLFDVVAKHGALSDPAYRKAREILNANIRIAHIFSWPMLVALSIRKRTGPARPPVSDDQTVQTAINDAMVAARDRFWTYLVLQTSTGWLLCVVTLLLLPWLQASKVLERVIERLIQSPPDEDGGSCSLATL